MKHQLAYLICILATATLLTGCGNDPGSKKMPALRETYSKTDTRPFGAYIAYRQLEAMFFRNTVRTARQSFDKTWGDIADTSSLYVCITPALFLNDTEVNAMTEYVERGNDLFISSGHIDERLLKKLNIGQYNSYYTDSGHNEMRITSIQSKSSPYNYFYLPFYGYFTMNNDPYIRPLGYNDRGIVNCIVFFHGKGRFFLHSDPRAFSNYFLLQKQNFRYLQDIMGYTSVDPEHLYWDDYYNKLRYRKSSGNENSGFSSLSEILKYPSLASAFWLSLILLILYILFGVKRKQSVIEMLKPNENTTVTFTETIGRLYLQKKDNKNIADKMITYFNEYIRNKYFLNTNLINPNLILTLSRKSGVPYDKVETLFRTINHVFDNKELDDYQLLSLNEQIQNFYKTVQ